VEHLGTVHRELSQKSAVARCLRWPVAMRLSVLLLLATGCVATPLPDPPSLEQVFVMPAASLPLYQVAGMAGAVQTNASVAVVNLDRTEPPVTVAADPDGGFSLMIMASPGNVLRMHVVVDGVRSAPVDFVLGSGTPTALVPTLGDCLSIPAAIDFGSVGVGSSTTVAVQVQNGCAATVQITSIALRTPVSGLTVRTAAPLSIAPSTSAVIEVGAAPSATGPLEEVVLIGIGAPATGRRAVTLYGSGG
jgi:hypothetical protein